MLARQKFVRLCSAVLIGSACALACVTAGCEDDNKPKPVARPTYPDLGAKKGPYYPEFLDGTIDQYTELRNTGPLVVTGFGLVVNADPLPNSKIAPGNQIYPTAVREYMLREMLKHRVGSVNQPGWENISPSKMLADPRNSIVLVQGLIPPGARGGTTMDIQIRALQASTTVSLSRGWLYQTDLAPGGGNIRAPGVAINIMGKAEGQVFVNPTLALNSTAGTEGQRASLREGVILDGGYIAKDRPLVLQLRTPQLSLARAIQRRIEQRFPAPPGQRTNASAKDEGLVEVFVPDDYGNDWEHFAGVMRYLYLNTNNNAAKMRELVNAALKPDAPLQDISYCWEGFGKDIINYIQPLFVNPNDDIAFAAARAAAFVGDISAQDVLMAIAQKPHNRFQLNAVQVLGALPPSIQINSKVRTLLDSPDVLVRVEAYRMLASHHDSSIFTRVIAKGNEKFVLDIVPSKGPPLIYASRSGQPRIAIIGAKPSLLLPLLYSAMDNRLTITSAPQEGLITIFYRGTEFPRPVQILSRPDLGEVISRLGGEGPLEDVKLDFGYCDVVGMLQSLSDSHKLVATYQGKQVDTTFVLQKLTRTPDDIENAPLLPGEARPQQQEPSGATSSAN